MDPHQLHDESTSNQGYQSTGYDDVPVGDKSFDYHNASHDHSSSNPDIGRSQHHSVGIGSTGIISSGGSYNVDDVERMPKQPINWKELFLPSLNSFIGVSIAPIFFYILLATGFFVIFMYAAIRCATFLFFFRSTIDSHHFILFFLSSCNVI